MCAGGFITLIATKESLNEELNKIPLIKIGVYLPIFGILTLVFLCFYLFFFYQNYNTIKNIDESGKFSSQESALNSKIELKIIEASYFSLNRSIDVTDLLKNLIVDNILSTSATNEVFGDIEPGKDKWLKIRYSLNKIEATIQYNQGNLVQLPQNKPAK